MIFFNGVELRCFRKFSAYFSQAVLSHRLIFARIKPFIKNYPVLYECVDSRYMFKRAILSRLFFHTQNTNITPLHITQNVHGTSYTNFNSHKTAHLIRNMFRRQISLLCMYQYNDTLAQSTWKRRSGEDTPPPVTDNFCTSTDNEIRFRYFEFIFVICDNW